MMKKLAIVATHPVQYNAPWFKQLAQSPGMQVHVFYTWSQSEQGAKFDPGFNKTIEWDIPLLQGYAYSFVPNVAPDPGSHHYKGIDTPTLIRDISNWKPDAVLVIGWAYRAHLSCLRYFKGKVPVLFRGDSTLLDEQPGVKKWLRRIFLKWVYRHVDHALYVGTENKKYYEAHGLKQHQLHYAPHAIENRRFADRSAQQEEKAAAWRKELGIPAGDFVCLFAGKFEAKKDPGFLIRMANALKDPNIHFILVGNGPMEAELHQQAAGDPRIHFIGFQNQLSMPVVYRLGDLFVLPSKGPGETWGLAINEAMACGRPVMASAKAGGTVDLVRPGINGWILDGKEAAAHAFVRELSADKEKARLMGISALEHIQRFSFDGIVHQTARILGISQTKKKTVTV